MSYKYELDNEKISFIDGSNKFLREHEDYETDKGKEGYCPHA